MKYSCLRCGLDFKQRCHLENHLNRKNICEPILEPMSIEEVKKIYGFDIFEDDCLNEPHFSSKTPHFSSKILKKSSLSLKDPQNDFLKNPQKCEETEKIFLKNPQKCEEKNKYLICKYCSKKCSRGDNLKRHLITCKKKKEYDEQEIKDEINNLKKAHSEQISKLKDTIDNLVMETKVGTNNNTTNNNNNTNISNSSNCNNDNSMNIHINNYGYENKDYITKQYLLELLKAPFQAIPKLIEYTHFNKEHPENQNIKLPNKKQPYVKVLKGDKWVYADRKSTILDLIDEKHCELNDAPLLKHIENKFSDSLQDRFSRFNERYLSDEKEFTSQLYKETELVMINNS